MVEPIQTTRKEVARDQIFLTRGDYDLNLFIQFSDFIYEDLIQG